MLYTRKSVTCEFPVIEKLAVDHKDAVPVVFNTPFEYVGADLPEGTVNTNPCPDLSFHCVTLLPDSVRELESAASNHNEHPGIVRGSNPKYCCVPKLTLVAIV